MWVWMGLALAGTRPAQTTRAVLESSLGSRRVAVLVGVDTYQDPELVDLRNATSDAVQLGSVLSDPARGGFEVKVLSGAPTRDQVLDSLRWAVRDLGREDTLLLYFSGHGTRVGSPQTRFLLASDSRPSALEATAIELEALQSWFSSLTPSRKVLIVDACFDGTGKSVLPPTAPAGDTGGSFAPPSGALGEGEAYLFATTPGRPALEDDLLGHGLYTYFVLDALSWSFHESDLDEDGVITIWEAHDHARKLTIERSAGVQVPEAALRVMGSADVVLVGEPAARAQQEHGLVYLYATADDPLNGSTLSVDGRVRGVLPGTIAVSPGRHWFELLDRRGVRVADGYLRIVAGRAVPVDALPGLLRGPLVELTASPTVRMAPGLARALPGPSLGVELSVRQRVGRIVLGARAATLGGPGPASVRPLLEAGLSIQARLERTRWHLLAGPSLGLTLLPPVEPASGINPYLVPQRAGWAWAAVGPEIVAGWTPSSWSVEGTVRPLLTMLDTDGDLRVEPVGWISLGVGLRWTLR